ncbi:hypothetical protein D9619_012555 [Psilocybe cf. subviscida]|uniref:Uncharacterized protein n=1 Tax=Psilocybe cf. subviscida TaxID=2480587 RepID=A0A8H5B6V7_9AGAR|nr:hypothetical protein D9619_012555 [Psilocybe cf. subviscida]
MNSNDSGCRLPLELLRTIVENVQSQAALLPVALASPALREEAQRILFMAPMLPTPLSHLTFLKTVIASPLRLALLVKTYTQFGMLYPGATSDQRQTLQERTAAALKVMVNLKKLGYRATRSKPAADILRDCTFRLTGLSWVCYGDDAQVLLREVLPHQSGLRHLGLLGLWEVSSDDIQAVKSLCPALSSLEGPVCVISVFLEGRKIRHLQWTLEQEIIGTDVGLPSLPAELHDVESLIYGANDDFPLRSVVSHLRSVKFLKISSREAEFEEFPELPNLRVLLLSDYTDPSPVAAASHVDSVATAFRHYKDLQYVDWQVGSRSYVRYTAINVDAGEFDAMSIEEDEVLPWNDLECFGFY